MARKPRHRDALVVIDEFSKLASRPDAAVELVERVRSFGVGVAFQIAKVDQEFAGGLVPAVTVLLQAFADHALHLRRQFVVEAGYGFGLALEQAGQGFL